MRKIKFQFIKELKRCWNKIDTSDKALIFIMGLLILQCIHNLFTPESATTNGAAISIIVRTTVAAIFGYFLSENFLKHESNNANNINNKKQIANNLKNELNELSKENNKNSTELNNKILHLEEEVHEEDNNSKIYICNKTFQIFVALTLCIISLLALIIGDNFNLIPTQNSPTVFQFRDIISSCVGFLLGHTSTFKKDESDK